MSIVSQYRPLFEVAVYHKYFLDDGLIAFDDNEPLQKKQLANYNWNSFGKIIPTPQTSALLKNHRMLLKQTQEGFLVLTETEKVSDDPTSFKPLVTLDPELILDFYIQLTDAQFFNFTDLDASSELPLFISNYNTLYNAADPVFIAPYNNSSNAKNHRTSALMQAHLYKKYPELKLNKLVLISLQMRNSRSGMNLILNNGNLPQVMPHFKIVFHNRKTIWRYYSGSSKSLLFSTDPDEMPLVKNGIIPVNQGNTDYPAPNPSRIIQERNPDGTIYKTYSNIYIN